MAKIFRFSGYFVDNEKIPYSKAGFKVNLTENIVEESRRSISQQFHIEESEEFEVDGELTANCDLALLTRHFKKDNSNMLFDRPLPKKGEKYKHFKVGKIVTVIGLSRHTESEEITVVYEYEGTIWNRPLEMFMSEVDHEKYPNVSQKYRFEKVESEGSHDGE